MSSTTLREQEHVKQLQYIERVIGENRLTDAARMLNTLAKTAPQDPRIFLLGSLMAEAANNLDGMLTAAKKAVDLAPGWPVASIRLAGVYSAKGQAGLAVQTAEQAIFEATQDNSLTTEYLTRASAIAVKCQHYPQAALWAEQASAMAPDSPHLKHLMAEALAYNGQYEEAVALYTELLTQEPDNTDFLHDRLLAYINTAQTALAQQDAERLVALAPDNETFTYYASMLKGETPATQPASVVTRLFDTSAAQFDQHLVGSLQYTLPQDVAQWILDWYPDKKVDVLDLGCGTGLLGAGLGPIKGVIVGVDLSTKMIEKAAQRGVYAQFNQVNVLDALQATPESHYDVITALDVLIYVGDLSTVIPNAHRILTPGGRFVFSCEAAPKKVKTFALQATQRFVHQQDHVNKLLKAAGFTQIQMETRALRLEAGEPVQGFVVTAQK
jgi:predicted TPR repeat methyltransferase